LQLPEVDGVPLIWWRPAGLLFRRFADARKLPEVDGVVYCCFDLPM
jgi:hypothetical protein